MILMRLKEFSILCLVWLLTACIASTPVPATQPSSAAPTASPPTATVTAVSPSATTPSPDARPEFLQRRSPQSIRILSYNINWDSIFPVDDGRNHDFRDYDRRDSFVRILRAINPDILCLQEINDNRPIQDLEALIEQILGSPADGESWHTVKARDNWISSRFNLRSEDQARMPTGGVANLVQATAWVDLPQAGFGDRDLYLICAHFKSGAGIQDIALRESQADAVMAHVRSWMDPSAPFVLPPQTPFVILGDFNVYDTDPARHLQTLLSGDILNEARFGPDLNPDWDASSLAEALPSHNGLGGEHYTWRDDSSTFAPGTLDRILFSDSVLVVENTFILNTTLFSEAELLQSGLRANDVVLDPQIGYYDHLPLVMDVLLR
jgi:endonuclease/exonuclease/phosphatase family metal-dependent hydrolase